MMMRRITIFAAMCLVGAAETASPQVCVAQIANPPTHQPRPEPVPCLDGCAASPAVVIGTQMTFDGVNDVARVDDWGYIGDGDSLTVAAWVRVRDLGDQLINQYGYDTQTSWNLKTSEGGYFEAYVMDTVVFASANYLVYVADDLPVIADSTWHHIAMTWAYGRTGDDLRLYVDGVLSESPTKTNDDPVLRIADASIPLNIGAYWRTDAVEFRGHCDCDVAHVLIYAACLSDAQIAALAAGGVPGTPTAGWGLEETAGAQTVTAIYGAQHGYRGASTDPGSDDPTWGDDYTSLGASGPVAWAREHLPHWTWDWLAWLGPPPAYAAASATPVRRSWACDVADVDSLAGDWPTDDVGVSLGGHGTRVCAVSRDTVAVYSHPLTEPQWSAIRSACSRWMRVAVTGTLPDSLEHIPTAWE